MRSLILLGIVATMAGCGQPYAPPIGEVSETPGLTGWMSGTYDGADYGGEIEAFAARPNYVVLHIERNGLNYMHQIGFVDLTGGVVDSAMLCVGEERGRWQYDAYAPGDDVDLIAVETADGFRVSYSYDVGGNSVEGFFELPTD